MHAIFLNIDVILEKYDRFNKGAGHKNYLFA